MLTESPKIYRKNYGKFAENIEKWHKNKKKSKLFKKYIISICVQFQK